MILVACGSAPTAAVAPAAAVVAPVVATVTSNFGAVTTAGLPAGQAQTVLTVTALDANGAPVVGAPVNVTVNGNLLAAPTTLVAGAVTANNMSGTTGPTGKATVIINYVVADGLSVVTTAGTNNVPSAPPVYTGNVPTPTLTFPPLGVGPYLADGYTSRHPITLNVTDKTGVAQANQTIHFTLSSPTAGISSLPGLSRGGVDIYSMSDALGNVQLYISDSIPEIVTLTATAVDGTAKPTTIQFTSQQADVVTLNLSATAAVPNTLITATATTLSAAQAALADVWVQFDIYTAAGTHIGPISKLSINGTATTTFNLATTLGISDVYATLPLNPLATTPLATSSITTVLATPKLTVTTAGPFLADGYTAGHAVQIQVKDALGNPVANQPLTLTMSGTAGASITSANQAGVSPLTVSSNANGVVDVYVSDATAEAVTLTATASDGTTVTSQPMQFIAANPATIALTSSATAVVPNTAVTFTAHVLNATPANVANAWVQFDAYSGGTKLGQFAGLTDALGSISTNFTLTTLGNSDIYATLLFNNGIAPAVQTVKVVVATPQLTVAAVGSFLADGITAGHAVQIQVKDALGNPAANQPLTLTMSGTAGASITSANQAGISPLTVSSNANGVVVVYVSDAAAEAVTLTATATDGTTVTSQPMQFIAANANKVNVVTSATTALPNGTSPITVTATVTANGIPVANALVDFYTSDTAINQTFASRPTSATGTASVNLTSFTQVLAADVYAKVQTSAGVITNANTRTTISFITPVATVLLQASPATLRAPADNYTQITLTATVLDATGKPLQGQTVSFTHASLATVTTPAVTDSYGQTTVQVTDANVEGATFTANAGAIASTPVTLSFVPIVNSVTLAVTPANPAQIPADGTSVATLTATVLDVQNNPISGQTVNFAKTLGASPVFNTAATTDAYGRATVTVTDGVAEDVYVTASADVYTSTPATMTFVDTAYLVSFANTGPFITGTANAVTMTVLNRNTRNPVQNLAFTVSGNGTAQLSPAQGTTGGTGTLALNINDTVAEAVVISAQVTGSPLVFTQPIQFVNKDAYSVSLTATPASVAPDGVSTATLTALVTDAYGTAAPNAHVQFTTTDLYAAIKLPQGVPLMLTDAYGRASVTMVSQVATNADVYASLPSNNGNKTSLPVTVAFEAPVASIVFQATPLTASADGKQNVTWTAYVLDAYSNRLINRSVTITASPVGTVRLTPSNPTGLDSYTNVTHPNGMIRGTVSDSVAEVVTLTATSGNISMPVVVNFTPKVGSMTVSVAPSNPIAAGGQATINVLIKDPYGVPMNGQMVYFFDEYTVTGSRTPLSSAQLQATSAATGANGVASITVSDLTAEDVAINVSYVQLESYTMNNNDQYANLTFAPSAYRYIITPSPTKAFVGVDSYVQVTVDDYAGKPVANQQLTISSASQTLIQNTATSTTITDAFGTAEFHFIDGVAETAVLNFTHGAAAFSTTVTIYPTGTPKIISLTATPNVGLAVNGVATISAIVVDQKTSVLISGAAVDFYTYDSVTKQPNVTASLSANRVLTNASGVATVNLSSSVTGPVEIWASVDGYTAIGSNTSSSFTTATFGQTASSVNLSAVSTQGTADGKTPINVTVAVLDALGAPVAKQQVNLTFSPYTTITATGLTNGSVTTDAYGQATFGVIDTYVEKVKVIATTANGKSGNIPLQYNAAVSQVLPVTVQFTNAINSAKQPIGGQLFDVYTTPAGADSYSSYATGLDTVQVKFFVGFYDTYGNPTPLANRTVTFSASGSTGGIPSVLPATATSAVDGYVQLSLTDTYAETVTVTATSGTASGTQAVKFSNPPASNIVFLSTVPTPAVVGIAGSGTAQSVTMNFQVVDTNNNLAIDATPVNFSIINGGLNGGESLTISQSTSNAGLLSTVFNAGSKAGTVQVRASLNSDPTIFSDVTVTVTGGLPSGNNFGLSTLPLNIEGRKVAGVTQAVTAHVADFFSNPVAPNVQAQFQTDFANITGTSTFVTNGNASSANATVTSAFPSPSDGFVTVVGQTIGGQHSKILSLATDPYNASTIYAGTDGGGIFKTIDGGQNWAHVGTPLRTLVAGKFANLTGGIVRDLKIDVNNTAVLYAATEQGVFLSRNAGQDWEPLTGFARVAGDTLSAGLDPYAGKINAGVFRSDGLWADSYSPVDGYAATLFPFNYTTTGVRSRMNVYLNGVQTRRYLRAGNGFYLTGTPGASGLGGIVLSADYDRQSNIGGGSPIYAIAYDQYSYDPNLGYSSILYAGTYGDGVWKTQNGGLVWSKKSGMLTQGTSFDLRITRLALDTYANNQGYVFAGSDGGGLYITDAYSMAWVRAVGTGSYPFKESVIQGITVQDPYVWIAGSNGVQYTTLPLPYSTQIDWYASTGIATALQPTNTDVRGFAVSKTGAMYAIAYGDVLAPVTGTVARGGVYRSLDQGASWLQLTDVYATTGAHLSGAHLLDSIDVYTTPVVGAGVTSLYDTVMVGAEGRSFYKGIFDANGTATWTKVNGTGANSITNQLYTTQQVMHSGSTSNIVIQPLTATYQPMNDYTFPGLGYLPTAPAQIFNGESVTYYIRVSDDLGNRLKAGSTITISADAGKVTGPISTTLADGVYGGTDYIVTWTNNIATAGTTDTPGTLNVAVTSVNGVAQGSVTSSLVNPLVGTSTPVVVSPYTTAATATTTANGGSNGAYAPLNFTSGYYQFTSSKGCVGTAAGSGATSILSCNVPQSNVIYGASAKFAYSLPGSAAYIFTDTITIRDLATGKIATVDATITAK